jgi:protein TonB
MSMKTSAGTKGWRIGGNLLPRKWLITSFLLHLAVISTLFLPLKTRPVYPVAPIIVEVVEPKAATWPEKPRRYSDRNSRAEKESVSEKIAGAAREIQPPAKKELPEKTGGAEEKPARLFPSEERLRELAKIYEKDPPRGEHGKVLSLNTAELKYARYILDMKRKIELYWDYPFSSARRGEEGALKVDFTVTKQGAVKGIKLVRSSNYPSLDDAAITAIRLANPFGAFPSNFEIEDFTVHASFEYRLISR